MSSSSSDKIHAADEEYFDDEKTKRAYEAAHRSMEEWRKERFHRRTADAIARGFSSWKEMEEHDRERDNSNYKAYLEAGETKATLRGNTVEELLFAEDTQRDSQRPYRQSQLTQFDCDCEGESSHP
jgi:uncharacterized membrane protein